MQKALSPIFKVSLCTLGYLCTTSDILLAQVTPDGTTSTRVNPDGNNFTIENGDRAGGNLFHSFSDFSVTNGGSAFFNNATDISNIFSRVTGGNISNIDGLIRANGNANLFLINPAGIIFGEGARLDIGGSFYGSSATSILFEDGEFSAADLDNPPLLTVNAPIGLGFRDNPGDITVTGDGNGTRLTDSEVIDTQDALRVGSDATIGIVGGNIIFEDATIKTAGGRIEIGSVAGGRVDLVEVANGFTFDYSGIETFRDISLSETSSIDASGNGGGDIQVAGNNISITGLSGFTSFTLGNVPGGDINVFASDSIDISGVENELNFVSGIFNRTFPNGTADAGDINIETGSLSIGDRSLIGTFVSGQGNAGNININARDSVTLESQGNTSAIRSNVGTNAIGNAGDINITSPSLTLSNGADFNVGSLDEGDAGDINISGNTVTLNDGSNLIALNSGSGTGGNVTINATDDVSFSNDSNIFVLGAEGGSINITAKNLSLISESNLFAGINIDSGFADAQAGDIVINLTEDLVLDSLDGIGTTAITNVNFGTGNAGNIEINAGNITFNNGANKFN